jgi:hypothetical protein
MIVVRAIVAGPASAVRRNTPVSYAESGEIAAPRAAVRIRRALLAEPQPGATTMVDAVAVRALVVVRTGLAQPSGAIVRNARERAWVVVCASIGLAFVVFRAANAVRQGRYAPGLRACDLAVEAMMTILSDPASAARWHAALSVVSIGAHAGGAVSIAGARCAERLAGRLRVEGREGSKQDNQNEIRFHCPHAILAGIPGIAWTKRTSRTSWLTSAGGLKLLFAAGCGEHRGEKGG